MKASNTRAVLAPFEGQKMHVLGRLKEYRRQDDGLISVCLVNCELRVFDPAVALTKQKVIRVEHLWNRNCPAELVDNTMLARVNGIGVVRQYARADGSVDWTVESIDSMSIDSVLREASTSHRLDGSYHRADRLGVLLGALELAKRVTPYAFGIPTNEAMSLLEFHAERLHRSYATQALTGLLAPAAGPCTGLRRASRIPGVPLSRPARGFA